MKPCYQAMLDVFEEMEQVMAKEGNLYRVDYVKAEVCLRWPFSSTSLIYCSLIMFFYFLKKLRMISIKRPFKNKILEIQPFYQNLT